MGQAALGHVRAGNGLTSPLRGGGGSHSDAIMWKSEVRSTWHVPIKAPAGEVPARSQCGAAEAGALETRSTCWVSLTCLG